MVQWCDGHDECVEAGASKRSAKWGHDSTMEAAGGGGGGMISLKMLGTNGTVIPPKEIGPLPQLEARLSTPPAPGPSDVDITESRSVSYNMSLELGFADIVSLGIGFEFTETMEESTSRKLTVGEGEEGDVAFTGFLQCTEGIGNCHGKDVHGKVCTPYNDNGGNLAGLYHVMARS
ncbi:hypothetical protein PG996_006510 [Apiospora saccharicola]|uniref:Uncharacterized protein n=1 Tax=Apiospora saccharicola TaxID=335842 RepID=A0ABR1VQN4_9PEZI